MVVHRRVSRLFKAKKLPIHVKERVLELLDALASSPRENAKHLKGSYHCLWRRRAGDYRVIYHIDDRERTVIVAEVCHRGRCY